MKCVCLLSISPCRFEIALIPGNDPQVSQHIRDQQGTLSTQRQLLPLRQNVFGLLEFARVPERPASFQVSKCPCLLRVAFISGDLLNDGYCFLKPALLIGEARFGIA